MAQSLRTPLRLVDESERKQKGSAQRSQQPSKETSQRHGIKRKTTVEPAEAISNKKRTKSPSSLISSKESQQDSIAQTVAPASGAASHVRSRSPVRASATRSQASRMASSKARSQSAQADPQPQGPLSPRRNSKGVENSNLLPTRDTFTLESIDAFAAVSSEALFFKKHSREMIARRSQTKPIFKTEEEELEWMFPSLPSDSENSELEGLNS